MSYYCPVQNLYLRWSTQSLHQKRETKGVNFTEKFYQVKFFEAGHTACSRHFTYLPTVILSLLLFWFFSLWANSIWINFRHLSSLRLGEWVKSTVVEISRNAISGGWGASVVWHLKKWLWGRLKLLVTVLFTPTYNYVTIEMTLTTYERERVVNSSKTFRIRLVIFTLVQIGRFSPLVRLTKKRSKYCESITKCRFTRWSRLLKSELLTI